MDAAGVTVHFNFCEFLKNIDPLESWQELTQFLKLWVPKTCKNIVDTINYNLIYVSTVTVAFVDIIVSESVHDFCGSRCNPDLSSAWEFKGFETLTQCVPQQLNWVQLGGLVGK